MSGACFLIRPDNLSGTHEGDTMPADVHEKRSAIRSSRGANLAMILS
jgi:hypothetical protein